MTNVSNPFIAGFAGEPALVAPGSSERFNSCLAQAAVHPDFAATMTHVDEDDRFWPDADDSWGCRVRPYVVKNGVLQIPVRGVLLHNFPYALGSWATGYDYIWRAFERGCGDFVTGAIKAIALVEDTPGGMVAGCFDAVDKMVALKERVGVPVRAFAHESAYSAGYAIATVADHVAVSRTGGVGSIGVVTSHVDLSGALEQAGVKVTFIASDPSKVEGNYTEPLSDDAKARIQTRIDELYAIFVAAVARSRGLEEFAIRGDLKAHCFTATQALSNGLADSIGSLDDALTAFCADVKQDQGDEQMTTQTQGGTVDQAAHDTAVANARSEGAREGATAERTRISAILGSDEAKDRGSLASHIAFSTDMTVDAAKGMLAAAPTAASQTPGATGGTFADVMDASQHPNVGGEQGSGSGSGQPDPDDHSAILALVQSAGVTGYQQPSK